MERVMKETERSIKIREKRKDLGDYDIYIAKDDPNHEPPLQFQATTSQVKQEQSKIDDAMKKLKDQLTQLGFSNVPIQNKVVNDHRCKDIDSAIDLYLEYDNKRLQNS